jgi:preprotein translocase subunit YajC
MNSLIPDAMAQTAGGAAAAPGQSPMGMVIMMVGFVVIFYFLLIRPQQKIQKEHQALLAKIGEGDEVVTAGGILGKVITVGDQFLTLEIADGVRIKVQRFQVTSLVPKGTLKGA